MTFFKRARGQRTDKTPIGSTAQVPGSGKASIAPQAPGRNGTEQRPSAASKGKGISLQAETVGASQSAANTPRNASKTIWSKIETGVSKFDSFSARKQVVLAAIALVLAFGLGAMGSKNPEQTATSSEPPAPEQSQSLANTGSSANDTSDSVPAMSKGVLSFKVESSATGAPDSYTVTVTGTTLAGDAISDTYKAELNQAYSLDDYPAGTYEFAIETPESPDGITVLACESETVTFDESSDKRAILQIKVDEVATKRAKEDKEKAEAEAKAAEEEAQRKAEAQAQAEAEAEAQAEAQAAAEAAAQAEKETQEEAVGGTVYIAASGNGSKYHTNPNCSRMKGTIKLTVSEAESRGYSPCSKCC